MLACTFVRLEVEGAEGVCRHLIHVLFSSYEKGTSNVELPNPRSSNAKSWSENKKKKAKKLQDAADAQPKCTEDDKPDEQNEDETHAEEKQPRNRRHVQVILARPSSSSDEEEDNKVRHSHEHSSKRPSENNRSNEAQDLRSKLRQKSQTVDSMHDSNDDVSSVIEESRAKRVGNASVRPYLKPRVVNLRDRRNSKSEDLRIKLNRPKRSDLRRKLEETKAEVSDKQGSIVENLSSDLRIQLQNKRAKRPRS